MAGKEFDLDLYKQVVKATHEYIVKKYKDEPELIFIDDIKYGQCRVLKHEPNRINAVEIILIDCKKHYGSDTEKPLESLVLTYLHEYGHMFLCHTVMNDAMHTIEKVSTMPDDILGLASHRCANYFAFKEFDEVWEYVKKKVKEVNK